MKKDRLPLLLMLLLLFGCRSVEDQTPEVADPISEPMSASSTATATFVSPLDAARTPAVAEPSLKRVTIPYWISLSYPASWFPLTGESAGVLGFSTHSIPLDPEELPGDGALFFVVYQQPESPDPLLSLQSFAETLVEGTEIWTEPEQITGIGESAARMKYSWPGAQGRVFVTEVTYVMDGQGRMATIWATSEEKQWEAFADQFRQLLNSLEFEEMMPPPGNTVGSTALDEPISYRHAPLQLELSYPDDWSPFVREDGSLQLVPQESLAQSALNVFEVSALPMTASARQGTEALVEMVHSDFTAAAPASPIAVTTVDGQELALRYYVTLLEQEPVLVLLASAVRDENGVVARGIMVEEEFRDEMEAIARSMVITPSMQDATANFTVDWSPDGGRLAFTSRHEIVSSIYMLQLSDGASRRLTDETENAGYADWSPDGSQIVYNAMEESGRHLFLRRTSGGNRQQLTDAPNTEDNFPDWSPDGSKIVFARYDQATVVEEDVDAEIYLLDLEEGSARSLNVRGTAPAFSPDGSRIAFVSDLNGAQDLYIMNADGSDIVQVTDDPGYDLWPAWSPDGGQLAFASNHNGNNGNYDIYVVNLDGSNRERLTDHKAPDYAPAWSPDGNRIAFDSNREGVLSIYIMDADGSNLISLADWMQ